MRGIGDELNFASKSVEPSLDNDWEDAAKGFEEGFAAFDDISFNNFGDSFSKTFASQFDSQLDSNLVADLEQDFSVDIGPDLAAEIESSMSKPSPGSSIEFDNDLFKGEEMSWTMPWEMPKINIESDGHDFDFGFNSEFDADWDNSW